MKKVLFVWSLFYCSFMLNAQSVYNEIDVNNKMQNILEFENKNATELYNLVKLWIADTYVNANEVIDADIVNKKIVVNGIAPNAIRLTKNVNTDLFYKTTFDFKDNRIRVTYSNLEYTSYHYPYTTYVFKKDGSERTNSQAKLVKESTNVYLHTEIYSLKMYIEKSVENEDW